MLANRQAVVLVMAGKAGREGVKEGYSEVAKLQVLFGRRSEVFLIFHVFILVFVLFFLYGMGLFVSVPCSLCVRSLGEGSEIRQCFNGVEARCVLLQTGMQMIVPLYQEETQR